jgi:hypothetical protein
MAMGRSIGRFAVGSQECTCEAVPDLLEGAAKLPLGFDVESESVAGGGKVEAGFVLHHRTSQG